MSSPLLHATPVLVNFAFVYIYANRSGRRYYNENANEQDDVEVFTIVVQEGNRKLTNVEFEKSQTTDFKISFGNSQKCMTNS